MLVAQIEYERSPRRSCVQPEEISAGLWMGLEVSPPAGSCLEQTECTDLTYRRFGHSNSANPEVPFLVFEALLERYAKTVRSIHVDYGGCSTFQKLAGSVPRLERILRQRIEEHGIRDFSGTISGNLYDAYFTPSNLSSVAYQETRTGIGVKVDETGRVTVRFEYPACRTFERQGSSCSYAQARKEVRCRHRPKDPQYDVLTCVRLGSPTYDWVWFRTRTVRDEAAAE
jgi:hypothetical protein